jgi:hypothetical protein
VSIPSSSSPVDRLVCHRVFSCGPWSFLPPTNAVAPTIDDVKPFQGDLSSPKFIAGVVLAPPDVLHVAVVAGSPSTLSSIITRSSNLREAHSLRLFPLWVMIYGSFDG